MNFVLIALLYCLGYTINTTKPFELFVFFNKTLTCVSPVHQSPASSQRHSPRDPFDSAEATSPSSYCPDYTVRALTDLQIIRVCVGFQHKPMCRLRTAVTVNVNMQNVFSCGLTQILTNHFLFERQVTRLQYLNALMASRVGQSPDPPEIKILPNSQTKLLNDKNTNQGSFAHRAV